MYGIAVLYRSSIPILLVIYFSVILPRCRWRVYGEYEYVRAAAAAGASGRPCGLWRVGPLSGAGRAPPRGRASPARPLLVMSL